jgi:glutamyl-tRNA reductase
MALILIGCNYRTAPMDVRERLSFSSANLAEVLSELYEKYLLVSEKKPGNKLEHLSDCECVILSTCNRLEVYAIVSNARQGWDIIEEFLALKGAIARTQLHEHLYLVAGHRVAEHLMHVTAGLDSMILGEPQIMGQVSEAFTSAQKAQTTGSVLSHLFSTALHASKRAHTETEISRHTTSVSHVAIQFVKKNIPDVRSARILLLGAGETAILAAKALKMHNAIQITYINRTQARAEAMTEITQGRVLPWEAIPKALVEADVVISTTSSSHPILTFKKVSTLLAHRREQPLVIVDLAVPRDVETTIGELPGIYLYDIDHLQSTLDMNLNQRREAIPDVEAIVKEETENFLAWLHGRQVVPILTDFRRKVTALANAEVKQTLNHMDGLNQHSQQAIEHMVHRIVNKVLHEPTKRLKVYAASGNGLTYSRAIQDLFALDVSKIEIEQLDCPCSTL